MKALSLKFFAVLFVLFCGPVFAQANSPVSSSSSVKTAGEQTSSVGSQSGASSVPKKAKTHTLNFEDELVDGSAQKPELFYLFQKKNFNYKRLIRLRENFLPEMRKTSADIQRSRGVN